MKDGMSHQRVRGSILTIRIRLISSIHVIPCLVVVLTFSCHPFIPIFVASDLFDARESTRVAGRELVRCADGQLITFDLEDDRVTRIDPNIRYVTLLVTPTERGQSGKQRKGCAREI